MPDAEGGLSEVVWTAPALANLRAIRTYIEQFNPMAARRVADELVAAGTTLSRFPLRGRSVPGTTLRELVCGYPYIIRYRVNGHEVVILRVRHTDRRPTKR